MLSENDSVKTTLIRGEPEICKAFLFEAAISWAREGQQVYYFTPKKFESLPLSFHDRIEPSANVLKQMTFIYTCTYEELVTQLMKLHTFQKPASLLLVDDLDEFTNHPDVRGCSPEMHVARCCAVLLNAAYSCAQIQKNPVHLCTASFTNERYNAIYRMYFDNHWSMSSETEPGDSEIGRKVWMRRTDNRKALEFCRLDDAVLVLRRVYGTTEDLSSN